jgi:hypothetical protein
MENKKQPPIRVLAVVASLVEGTWYFRLTPTGYAWRRSP